MTDTLLGLRGGLTDCFVARSSLLAMTDTLLGFQGGLTDCFVARPSLLAMTDTLLGLRLGEINETTRHCEEARRSNPPIPQPNPINDSS
jgi:hypothetical protein